MKVQMEINTIDGLLENCWSGAVDTINHIVECGQGEALMDYLNEAFCGRPETTLMEVNDFLWFDRENIYSDLGIGEEE